MHIAANEQFDDDSYKCLESKHKKSSSNHIINHVIWQCMRMLQLDPLGLRLTPIKEITQRLRRNFVVKAVGIEPTLFGLSAAVLQCDA